MGYLIETYSGHTPQQKYVSELVQAASYFQGDLPKIVWHYTSVESFKKILESQALIFTQFPHSKMRERFNERLDL
jgi:hypothetical protein